MSQTILYDIEINTEKDIERDDYDINFPTIFYRNPDDVSVYQDIWDKDAKNECKYIVFVKNEDGSSSTTIDEAATLQRRKNVIKNASLLHRIFDKVPHYSIKYVDDTLKNIQREYSINGTSVYDFLTGDCAEQTECLFLFNSIDRSVSVYDLDTNCLNSECNYRGDFTDVCPKCGCTHLLSGYGEDTTVNIDKYNLTESVSYETSVDDIKNCFKLTAGDDLMTATVRQLNQNGSSYIYYISEEQKEDMSDELVSAINAYDKKYNSYTTEYETLVGQYYDVVDDIVYYTSGMMPGDSADGSGNDSNNTESLATKEAAKLTVENLQQTALSSITKNTACSTANSALKLYARLFVRTGYVKVEIDETKANSFVYNGKIGDFNYGTWTGTFKVTNYSDTEDIAYVSLSFDINDNYEEFIKQKVMKEMLEKDDDGDMFDVLSIDVSTTEGQNKFKDAITLYCKNRLVSLQDAVMSAINMIATYKDTQPEFYEEFNAQYQFMFNALNSELSVRQATIDNLNTVLETVSNRMSEIQNLLDFETNLGKELYDEFCAYRREQEYSNSNFITDGLDNNEIIKRAKEFIELAKKELVKSATRQHTLSSSLNNLFADPTFEPLKDKVALGNWIRLGVDGNVYRLRLISYQINRSEMSKIPVEFSDATRTLDGYNDIKNIITSAQSMATSYGYVSKQADSGYEAQKEISNLRKDGLNSANIRIMNNTKEEVTVDNNGILARSYDDIEDDYDKEQFRITHNIMCFTDDAWRTSKTAIGKINYVLDGVKHEKYGVIADTMIAGTMISGDIYSDNYSSTNKKGAHIDLSNGDFTLADGKLNYDSDKNVLSLSGVTLDWNSSNKPLYMTSELSDWSTVKQGIDNGISDAKKAGTDADTHATNVKNYVDGDYTTALTQAYQSYTDSKISEYDETVAKYLTAGGKTTISEDYVLSPYIGGGYLNVTGSKTRVIIDPSNVSKTGYVFAGFNTSTSTTTPIFGIDRSGNAIFGGKLVAATGTFAGSLSAATGSFSGEITANSLTITDGASVTGLSATSITTGTIDASKVSVINLNASNITSGTIDASKITVTNLNASNITSGTISCSKLKGGTINGQTISGGTISGSTITCTAGKIGGFTINSGYIYNGIGIGSAGSCGMSSGSAGGGGGNDDWIFWAGNGAFRVTNSGYVSCTNASVTGVLTTSKGSSIGSFTTDNNSLFSGSWGSSTPEVFMCSGSNGTYTLGGETTDGWCFGAGSNFGVTIDGKLYCSGGKIGGFDISSSALGNTSTPSRGHASLCIKADSTGSGGASSFAVLQEIIINTLNNGVQKWQLRVDCYNGNRAPYWVII